MTPTNFVEQLAALRFRDAFNPYADECSSCDVEGASKQRAAILSSILEAARSVDLDSIWVGRDLGYRGGRRTGLALTDDVHFHAHLSRWHIDMDRPTIGQPVSERTASVIWQVLERIDRPIFLWNVYPLHPHAADDPFSNRSHNAAERRAGMEVLSQLVSLLKPRRLVAVGNDAEKALHPFGGEIEVIKVRHPSYGGQADFLRQVRQTYGLVEGSLL